MNMSVSACGALVVMMLGLLAGCTTYQPGTGEAVSLMSLAEARKIVRTLPNGEYASVEGSPRLGLDRVEIRWSGLRFFYTNGQSNNCRFDQITPVATIEYGFARVRTEMSGCPRDKYENVLVGFGRDGNKARLLADAIHVLKQDYLARTAPESPQQQAAFDSVVRQYRETQPPPTLPEGAARFKVQAEFAVQQKRFEDAVDLYAKALEVAPWWSQGRYNRGLLLGEIGAYGEATRELQKYLKLEPGAPNARAVQEQIYRWESVTTR